MCHRKNTHAQKKIKNKKMAIEYYNSGADRVGGTREFIADGQRAETGCGSLRKIKKYISSLYNRPSDRIKSLACSAIEAFVYVHVQNRFEL